VIANDLLDDYREVWAKLIGVEMEAGGTASAAFQAANTPGFFMVRGVSDLADAAKDADEVQQWRAYACDVAAAYAIGLLRSGPIPLVAAEGADRPQ
jgi:nucleoside phosphorylase